MTTRTHFTSAASIGRHLDELQLEQEAAEQAGLLNNGTYREHLDQEIAAMRSAYVGAAVTEIATLRAALDGPLVG
jgi:hypothetical protein